MRSPPRHPARQHPRAPPRDWLTIIDRRHRAPQNGPAGPPPRATHTRHTPAPPRVKTRRIPSPRSPHPPTEAHAHASLLPPSPPASRITHERSSRVEQHPPRGTAVSSSTRLEEQPRRAAPTSRISRERGSRREHHPRQPPEKNTRAGTESRTGARPVERAVEMGRREKRERINMKVGDRQPRSEKIRNRS